MLTIFSANTNRKLVVASVATTICSSNLSCYMCIAFVYVSYSRLRKVATSTCVRVPMSSHARYINTSNCKEKDRKRAVLIELPVCVPRETHSLIADTLTQACIKERMYTTQNKTIRMWIRFWLLNVIVFPYSFFAASVWCCRNAYIYFRSSPAFLPLGFQYVHRACVGWKNVRNVKWFACNYHILYAKTESEWKNVSDRRCFFHSAFFAIHFVYFQCGAMIYWALNYTQCKQNQERMETNKEKKKNNVFGGFILKLYFHRGFEWIGMEL